MLKPILMGSAARAVDDDSGANMAIETIRKPLSTHLRMPIFFPRIIIESSLIYIDPPSLLRCRKPIFVWNFLTPKIEPYHNTENHNTENRNTEYHHAVIEYRVIILTTQRRWLKMVSAIDALLFLTFSGSLKKGKTMKPVIASCSDFSA
jgi:hypothetical protein